jgi:signal transduction histidine kinase
MSAHGIFHVSLAAKCRLLFGLAVVLIIGAALFVPWHTLETMVRDRNVQQARFAGQLAYAWMDPSSNDWSRQQELLDQWWEDNRSALRLPEKAPRLIALPAGGVPTPFTLEALERWQEPVRWTAGTVGILLGNADPLVALRFAPLLWRILPEGFRDRGRAATVLLGQQFVSALLPDIQVLDEVQAEAVAYFQKDATRNEFHAPDQRLDDGPTVHRYILAVRRPEAGVNRRPLAGIIDMALPAPKTDEDILFTRIIVALAGSLAGFLAILVFYLITQKLILAPVRNLKTLAEQIAGGDLSARSHINTGDEFEELSTAFNDMLGQLERARVELEKINRSLDIRLGELAETNVALYESNRVKSEFLANVSHELRTPLTSIIGFADLLRDSTDSDGSIDKGRFARYVDNILTSGRMLLDIINDLLDLAKIEAGKVELHRSTFSPREVCETLADFMRPIIEKKGQSLNLALDENLPMMQSDAGKLRQILYNLLSNANKYTPEGGLLSLEAHYLVDSGHVRLAVTDNGPGIAIEDQERIFEKFRQLDSSVTREHSGTGLGLAISRELCIMLGGNIRVESEPDQGARFIIELPTEAPVSVSRPLPALT